MNIRNYKYRRPIWAKVLGDTCVYAGTLVSAGGHVMKEDVVFWIGSVLAVGGFFFSNLFKETDKELTRIEEHDTTPN